MKTASPSVRWAYVCTRMVMKPPNTVLNTGVQRQTGNGDVSVNLLAPRRNTAGPYTFSPMITQDCLTYHQGTAKRGKKNMTEGLPWNTPTSMKKDYILEDDRHRSTKMWYRRLYGIMMLQHLDAWKTLSIEVFQKSLLGFAA